MVDYTTSKSGSGGGIGLLIGAGIIVLVVLYALFAGGGATTTDPNATIAPEAAPAAIEETAPASN